MQRRARHLLSRQALAPLTRAQADAVTSKASTAVTSATHSSAGSCGAGSELAEPGAAAVIAKRFDIERPKYATPVQPFKPYDAWRLGPPIPGCEDERIENAHAVAEFRTPSDPAVGAPVKRLFRHSAGCPRRHPAAVCSARACLLWPARMSAGQLSALCELHMVLESAGAPSCVEPPSNHVVCSEGTVTGPRTMMPVSMTRTHCLDTERWQNPRCPARVCRTLRSARAASCAR